MLMLVALLLIFPVIVIRYHPFANASIALSQFVAVPPLVGVEPFAPVATLNQHVSLFDVAAPSQTKNRTQLRFPGFTKRLTQPPTDSEPTKEQPSKRLHEIYNMDTSVESKGLILLKGLSTYRN